MDLGKQHPHPQLPSLPTTVQKQRGPCILLPAGTPFSTPHVLLQSHDVPMPSSPPFTRTYVNTDTDRATASARQGRGSILGNWYRGQQTKSMGRNAAKRGDWDLALHSYAHHIGGPGPWGDHGVGGSKVGMHMLEPIPNLHVLFDHFTMAAEAE